MENNCNTFGSITNLGLLGNSILNKGLAFSNNERVTLNLEGLLPPRVITQDQQIEDCLKILNYYEKPLNKYKYLMEIEAKNIRLFYSLLDKKPEELIPLVYTPTIGSVCQNFGIIYRDSYKGLFISIHDRGRIEQLFANWPRQNIKVICVTDGERILGLGDLGVYGMGICIGKLMLYTALAGIDPSVCLPVTLDVGTNNKLLFEDSLYLGLKQNRMIENTYDEFVNEFMQAAVNRFGKSILIHFEDFANKNAFSLLNKYREEYCVFNDDIQGTGACVLAGILASCKIRGVPLANNIILFFGAGEAALGISELLVKALIKENISEEEAIQKLWLIDSQGLIVHNRPEGRLEDLKLKYAKNHQPMKDLLSIIRSVKPSILIGASGIPRVFTKDILEEMALINKEPVIFALSNPTSKSECTAKEAFTFTKGNCLFASGSPFESVVENNVRYFPSQANNYLVFPGLALGIISVRISPILDEDFLLAANTLVSCLNECDLKQKLLFPPITKCKSYSLKIATKLAEQAYKDGRASLFPEPLNKKNFIENSRYDFSYK